MNHEHSFSTPLARDLFSMGVESLMGGDSPQTPYRFGEAWIFSNTPCHLPAANPRDVEAELARLERPKFRGTPKEL